MERFIRIGNYFVNLDCVVRFAVEDDESRVTVLLRDVRPENEAITVDGPDAEPVIEALRAVQLGAREAQPAQSVVLLPISSMPPVLPRTSDQEIGVTIDE